MTLKQHEVLDLSMRDLLGLFRRCEEIADVIDRGRKNGGKYGTADALLRLTSEFTAEVRRLRDSAGSGDGNTEATYSPSEDPAIDTPDEADGNAEAGASAPWPKSEEELLAVIRESIDREHDYESSAEAVVTCTTAAFNYAASALGITGFQAGWASLRVFGETKSLRGPFAVLDGEQLLYPQYDLEAKAREWIEKWRVELAPTAKQRLAEINPEFPPHPDVIARWQELAALDEAVA